MRNRVWLPCKYFSSEEVRVAARVPVRVRTRVRVRVSRLHVASNPNFHSLTLTLTLIVIVTENVLCNPNLIHRTYTLNKP